MKKKKERMELTNNTTLSWFKLLIEEILKGTNIKYSQLKCETVKRFGKSSYAFFRMDGIIHLIKITVTEVDEAILENDMIKVNVEYVISEPIDIMLERNRIVASGTAILFMQK